MYMLTDFPKNGYGVIIINNQSKTFISTEYLYLALAVDELL